MSRMCSELRNLYSAIGFISGLWEGLTLGGLASSNERPLFWRSFAGYTRALLLA